ncbi:hypothetical protein JCM24511_06046 [Saitozyma sp. JCM 24511]|nr:hypothetical protein JCM24511_06046 [Saitozyma sp. JCM 24511]
MSAIQSESLTAEQYSALPTYQKLDRLRKHLDYTKQTVTTAREAVRSHTPQPSGSLQQDMQTYRVMGLLLAEDSTGTASMSMMTKSLFQQLHHLQIFEPTQEPPVTQPSDPFHTVMEKEFTVILQELENLRAEFDDVSHLDDLDKQDVTKAATSCYESMLRFRNAARWRCGQIGSETFSSLSQGTYNLDL